MIDLPLLRPLPMIGETLLAPELPAPVTLASSDRTGTVLVEHVRLKLLERRSTSGGEVVLRVHLVGGRVLTRGPSAPLLIVSGYLPIEPTEQLAGDAVWRDLRRQAGTAAVLLAQGPAS